MQEDTLKQPVKDDRFVTREMNLLKASLDAKLALELALLGIELINLLASSEDSDVMEDAIVDLQAKRLAVMQLEANELRTDYLSRLIERSRHVVNIQLLQPDLEEQSGAIIARRLRKVERVLIRKRTGGVAGVVTSPQSVVTVNMEVVPTAVVNSVSATATVGSGSVIDVSEVPQATVASVVATGVSVDSASGGVVE